MNHAPLWLSCAAIASITAAPAFAEGPIATLPRGNFACELPGDASARVGVPQPDANFTIENASRYSSPQGGGTYLLRGSTLLMTSGPRQGESFVAVSPSFLRRLEGGKAGRLRCVLSQ